MIGLVVKGRTYDSDSFSVSLNPVQAKVIDTGSATVRIWPNSNSESMVTTVDFLLCAPFNGISYSTTETVKIPFFLLTEIVGASVDTTLGSYVSGQITLFKTQTNSDFSKTLESYDGGIITKAKCPKIIWSGTNSYLGFSDYFVCYPQITTITGPTFNTST